LEFAKDSESGLVDAGWTKYSEGTIEVIGGIDDNWNEAVSQNVPKAKTNNAFIGYIS
jgi:hypothetical protein